MFWTCFSGDLPSEETPGAAPGDGLGQTHDRVVFTPARLLRTLQQVFEQADIRDVVYITVDGRTIYLDGDDSRTQDLDELMNIARDGGVLTEPFHNLRMVLSLWEDGIQHVVEAAVDMEVPVGQDELVLQMCSRPDDFNARRLDDAQRFLARVADATKNLEHVATYRARVEAVAFRLEAAMRRTLFRRTITVRRPTLRIVRPDDDALHGLTRLPFGPDIVPPTYQPRPLGAKETPAWGEISTSVYDDPYVALRHWALLDAVMRLGHLRIEWVLVVDADGRPLFEGHKARWFEQWPWGQKHRVTPREDGGLDVELS